MQILFTKIEVIEGNSILISTGITQASVERNGMNHFSFPIGVR